MSVQSIYSNVAAANVNTTSKATENKKEETTTTATSNKTSFEDTAVVYEKSSTTDTVKPNKNTGVDRDAIVAQIKAENEARINQMQELVRKMMQGQGNALAQSDDIWSFLASGDYTVTEAAKLGADIATVPYSVIMQMLKHPLTDAGIEITPSSSKIVRGELKLKYLPGINVGLMDALYT